MTTLINTTRPQVLTRLTQLEEEEYTEPMYLSQTHGLIAISKMETRHITNAALKLFRGVFDKQPLPIRGVIKILSSTCGKYLPPLELSLLLETCCDELGWADDQLNTLLNELKYRNKDK